MKHSRRLLFAASFVYCILTSQAQPWMQSIKINDPSFYDIQTAFNNYWKGKPVEKGSGYKPFKRWEWYWEQRVDINGQFPPPDILFKELGKLKNNTSSKSKNPHLLSPATWAFYGPSTSNGGYSGIGRINCIAFHPTIANTFWVGTPGGGLWKTTTGGFTWTTTTDNLPVLGVSDIAIDPNTPNTIYIATGDGDIGGGLASGIQGTNSLPYRGDTKSVGVLKSTDGGNTFTTTGLNWTLESVKTIRRLLINPVNPQILLVATSDGIWRTIDAGVNWTKQQPGWFMDLEFNPINPNIVYASSFDILGTAQIYRSTNGGVSWNIVSNLSGVVRINLAVSANDPTVVHAVCVNTSYGLEGLYKSTNSGASFVQYLAGDCFSTNMLSHWNDGSGCTGQGYYDLAFAINPSNVNDIWLGGVNTWQSNNGGVFWSLKNIWTNQLDPFVQEVHADKHFLAFNPLQPGYIYECNDGGLYVSTDNGFTWTDLTNGMGISEIYRLGTSATVSDEVICGLQDNGTKTLDFSNWADIMGGDGMECIIDYTNANIKYASVYYGRIHRTFDNWNATNDDISLNIPGNPTGAWITPFVIDPVTPQVLYAGYDKIFKTTNRGDSWTAISPTLTSRNIRSLAVAPSNPQYIYAANYDSLFFTSNGGNNWTTVTLPFSTGKKITYIAVHSTNPQKLWITYSGYESGSKVFESINGGLSFTNISGTLPNIPVNCIVHEKNTNDALYIGTDLGVFYKNGYMSDWEPYNSGLPNVVVTELEISYNDNKLWAATYGRGLWKSNLNTTTTVLPVASMQVNNTSVCPDSCVNFTDKTANYPIAWNWSFPGATPSTSTRQHPTNICYSTPGTYTVSLVVSNITGSDTLVLNDYVTVDNCYVVSLSASTTTLCATQCVNFADGTANNPQSWQWSFPGGSPSSSTLQNPGGICYNVPGVYDVSLSVSGPASSISSSVSYSDYIVVNPCPVFSFVTTNTLVCVNNCINFTSSASIPASSWNWSFPGGTPSSSTQANPGNICYNIPGLYDVELIGSNIYGSDTLRYTNYIEVDPCVGIENTEQEAFAQLFPNPFSESFVFQFILSETALVRLSVCDLLGRENKVIANENLIPGNYQYQVDLRDYTSGVYLLKMRVGDKESIYKLIKQ